MNIFATSPDPIKSAIALDDKRVVKMIVESAQLLSAAVRHHGVDVGYKYTHANHPCGVWARDSFHNYRWLSTHALWLCEIYGTLFRRKHSTQDVLWELDEYASVIPDGPLTPFPNCTDYKGLDDVHEAYRRQMCVKWDSDWRKPTWKGREPPDWYVSNRP